MAAEEIVGTPAVSQIAMDLVFPLHIYQTLRAEGYDKGALTENARESLASRLYSEHRLSIGQAAELAGLPLVKFMELLRHLNMAVVEYRQDEYAQDLETIDHLRSREHA